MGERVFLSWSGERSKAVATFLNNWLPNILQTVDPWISIDGIAKGRPWFDAVADAAAGSDQGIVVLTRENLLSEWIHFEAGALIGQFGAGRVCPLAVGLTPSEIPQPLGGFNVTDASVKTDVERLVMTLCPPNIEHARVARAFEREWPELEATIAAAVAMVVAEPAIAPRSETDKLDEILTFVRAVEGRGVRSAAQRRLLIMDEVASVMGAVGQQLSNSELGACEVMSFDGETLDLRVDASHPPFDELVIPQIFGRLRQFGVRRITLEAGGAIVAATL